MSPDAMIGSVENFVGVYSGRLTSEDFETAIGQEVTELGLAWRKDALDEIVNWGILATKLDQILSQTAN